MTLNALVSFTLIRTDYLLPSGEVSRAFHVPCDVMHNSNLVPWIHGSGSEVPKDEAESMLHSVFGELTSTGCSSNIARQERPMYIGGLGR